jgi:hypothetical protein
MKKNYILLDVNGTIGTDEPPFLENLLNPENFVWIEKVQAHVNLSTLYRIKEMAEKYDAGVLWASLRGDDALCLNKLINVDWGWLDLNAVIDRSNEWTKTAPVAKFANEHPNSTVIFCDDMLLVGGAFNELASQARNLKLICPSTTSGLEKEDLEDIEDCLLGKR